MSLVEIDAKIQRLLVRERSRRVLSPQKEQQLRDRLRRAAAAEPTPTGLRVWGHRLRFFWLHPVLLLALLLFCGGVAVAIVNVESSWWPARWRPEFKRVPRVPPATSGGVTATPAARVLPIDSDVGASLRAEVVMIGRARRELAAGKHEAAARSLSAHAQRFPAGSLLQEREGLAVMVLWHRGHRAQARQAAERFALAHPKSPMNRPLKELMDSTR